MFKNLGSKVDKFSIDPGKLNYDDNTWSAKRFANSVKCSVPKSVKEISSTAPIMYDDEEKTPLFQEKKDTLVSFTPTNTTLVLTSQNGPSQLDASELGVSVSGMLVTSKGM